MEITNTYISSTSIYDQLASQKSKEIASIDKNESGKSTFESYDVSSNVDNSAGFDKSQEQEDGIKTEDALLTRNASLTRLYLESLEEESSNAS